MPSTKKDVSRLSDRAVNSLILGVELFNRPNERGRAEAVLILLHHAFEMLLKSIILDETGNVHNADGKYTYSFDRCLEVCQSSIGILNKDQRTTLSILDSYRDTSMHFYQELSEDLLYLQAQAAATLFDDLWRDRYEPALSELIPDRVLPISTRPPKDLSLLVDSELSQIDQLLKPGTRKGDQAAARLRPILALAVATQEGEERVSEKEIDKAIGRRRAGEDWSVIFPEIAQLRLDTEGDGIPVNLRIRKNADMAVRIAGPGENPVGTVIKQEINIFDKYNLSRDKLAEKLNITGPRTSALIVELAIRDDPELFKEIAINSQRYKRYTKKALDCLRQAIDSGIDIDEIWLKHRHLFGAGPRK